MPRNPPEAVPVPVRKVESRMAELDPDSQRYRVLSALRQFRASWIELGRMLNEVVYGGDYKEWGYDDFEVYCARELGLKKPTVQKLMISYNYMKKYEAKRLVNHEDGVDKDAAPILDYQTVENCLTGCGGGTQCPTIRWRTCTGAPLTARARSRISGGNYG